VAERATREDRPWNSRPSGEKVFTPRSREGLNTILGVIAPLRTVFGAGQKHFEVAEVQARRVIPFWTKPRPAQKYARIQDLGISLLSWVPIRTRIDCQTCTFTRYNRLWSSVEASRIPKVDVPPTSGRSGLEN
jgi:hypothetical protein